MQRTAVTSATIESIGYDRGSRALEIAFVDGRVVRSYQVPSTVYQDLMETPPPDPYFYGMIEDRYPSAPVKEAYR